VSEVRPIGALVDAELTGSALGRVLAAAEGSAASILLLGALAAAAFAQGGFFARGQIAVGALLAAAVFAALPFDGSSLRDVKGVVALGCALAGWGVIRAAAGGSAVGGVRQALLLAGFVVTMLVARQLDQRGRWLLLRGMLVLGVAVVAVGWLALLTRSAPWATRSAGIWRAASTLTYTNAMAALLVPLALVVVALLARRPRSLPLALGLNVLLLGVAITFSRAGFAAMVLGMIALVALRGVCVLRALVAPLIGAMVALVAVLPSVPVWPHPRLGLGLVGLLAGLGLTALACRATGRLVLVGLCVLPLAAGAAVIVAFPGPARHVWTHRASVASKSRSNSAREAVRLVERDPLTGAGFGPLSFTRTDELGRLLSQEYVHDEYLQTLVQEGVIGAALLAALLAGLGMALWRSSQRSTALWAGVVAASLAAAVHAGFDFVWHVPAVPLTLAALIGLAVTPAARIGRAADGKETG
jgi:hypothetical protein